MRVAPALVRRRAQVATGVPQLSRRGIAGHPASSPLARRRCRSRAGDTLGGVEPGPSLARCQSGASSLHHRDLRNHAPVRSLRGRPAGRGGVRRTATRRVVGYGRWRPSSPADREHPDEGRTGAARGPFGRAHLHAAGTAGRPGALARGAVCSCVASPGSSARQRACRPHL